MGGSCTSAPSLDCGLRHVMCFGHRNDSTWETSRNLTARFGISNPSCAVAVESCLGEPAGGRDRWSSAEATSGGPGHVTEPSRGAADRGHVNEPRWAQPRIGRAGQPAHRPMSRNKCFLQAAEVGGLFVMGHHWDKKQVAFPLHLIQGGSTSRDYLLQTSCPLFLLRRVDVSCPRTSLCCEPQTAGGGPPAEGCAPL